jgi:flagellar biosynthesis protein FliQ
MTELAREALMLLLAVAAPMLLAALTVGLVVGLLQALTQVQDVTLSIVPKILAVLAALLLSGSWMLQRLVEFTQKALGP